MAAGGLTYQEELEEEDDMELGEKEESSETKSFKSDTDQKRDTPSVSSVSSSTPTQTPTPEPELDSKSHGRGTKSHYLLEEYVPPAKKSSHDLTHTYCWDTQLTEASFVAAPVSTFSHAPMADGWDNIIVGMKVEVENSDADPIPGVFSTAYWVATVLRIQGYKVLLRYEGFGQDGSRDFWMNLCSEKVHPVGWCATKGKPLIPPKSIQAKYQDWKEFLVKRLTGARTLPTNFYKVVWESCSSMFKKGMKLEVVDKMRISQVRVATVVDITGRRLQLAYDDNGGAEAADGFWCHEESPLIHPVGWARRVGHQITAPTHYHDRCQMETFNKSDSTPDMFPEYRQPSGLFKAGVKLEAVDPLNLSTICVATVMKVLRHGYIMIRMDGYESDPTGGDWFCYHGSSPFVFPPGFCVRNSIKLKAPAGFEGDFQWVDYLKSTQSEAAPIQLFSHKDDCKHFFKVGMKVECTDLMDPRLVCVSTVNRVVNRLLKVHFDGWEEDFDQWMDCESVDIYPVGWCELVGHRLEGPRMKIPPAKKAPAKEKKRKSTGGGTKKVAKIKKKGSTASPEAEPEQAMEEVQGEVEPPSRSPTPTPPVLQPEVPLARVQEIQQEQQAEQQQEPEEKEQEQGADEKEQNEEQEQEEEEEAMQEEEEPVVEEEEENMYIPRLLDAAGNATPRARDQNLEPAAWTVKNLASFLEVNECSNLVTNFGFKQVDGLKFLTLTKQDIMSLVNNKMGPCLKIENLQKLLRDRLTPAQARGLAFKK